MKLKVCCTCSVYKMRKKDMMKKIKKNFLYSWQLYVMLIPAAVFLILFSYQPMYGVQIAFRDFRVKDGIWGSEWVGLKHFINFIHYPNFGRLMLNTLKIGLYGFATFPVSIIFALLLDEVRNQKFKKTVQMLSYIPHFLSTVVVVSMLSLFCDAESGIFNTIIDFFGGQRQNLMTVPKYFTHLYVWSGVWQGVGWGAIIYVAALAGVQSELIEAARIDGAGRFQIIRHVKIPAIMPTIVIMLILSCGGILSVGFDKIYLMQNSLNLSVSQVIASYTYEIGLRGGQFSYSSAIGLFNTVINLVILNIVNVVAKKTTEIGIW